jgi:hypothetical protein
MSSAYPRKNGEWYSLLFSIVLPGSHVLRPNSDTQMDHKYIILSKNDCWLNSLSRMDRCAGDSPGFSTEH